MIRGVRAAKRAPSWQDLRAVYSQTAVCGAFRMHGANILPKPARFGCTAAICCQEGALFPSEAPSGTHEVKKLPRIASRERIAAISCHGRQPENASGHNLATVGRWGTHFASVLPSTSARKRHRGGMMLRPAARKRIGAQSCHGRQPGDAFRRNIAATCPLGTHGVDMLPRQGAPGICGRDMLPLPVGAALARCRDEGAGGARGSIDPSAASGASALRSPMVHTPQCFREVGGTAQPARCRVRLGALIAGAWSPFQRPHGRGARPFSAA